MALDMFLMIPGVSGESQDKTFRGAIDVLSYRFGVEGAPLSASGAGGSGKPNLSDISMVTYQSTATVPLYVACAAGKHYASAVLSLRRPDGATAGLVYFTIKLTDVTVTSITEGAAGGDDRPTDALSLSFAQIDLSYKPQNPDGSAGTAVTGGWDVALGKPR